MQDNLRFRYVSVRNTRGEATLRPHIPLMLTYQDTAINSDGLLDTGADVNVLPYDLGIRLGAVWDDQRTSIRLSGNLVSFDARGIIVTAVVGHFEPVRLAFAWTKAVDVPLILGQVNFFLEFDVCFFGSQHMFDVHPKNNSQNGLP